MTKIAQTWHSNVQPDSLRMCGYKLVPIRRAENLHAVVAGAKEKRAEYVDQKVNPDVQSPRSCATTLEQRANGAFGLLIRTGPYIYGDGEIKDAY